ANAVVSGGSSGRTSAPTASPQPPTAATHFGFSTRAPLPPSAVHGGEPTYVPDAIDCASPPSTSPTVSNSPATFPLTSNTTNRGTPPRSITPVTSSALSVQPTFRMINGATPGRPPAPSGHISPTTT